MERGAVGRQPGQFVLQSRCQVTGSDVPAIGRRHERPALRVDLVEADIASVGAASVRSFFAARRMVPGVAPRASMVPLMVRLPLSIEMPTECALMVPLTVRSPCLMSKLRAP